MICEAPTTSGSESNFTDPESHVDKTIILTFSSLEQFELVSDLKQLQIVRFENVSLDGSTDEMPIVKKNDVENGSDKGIFSVSRVKKVELSEISLASDICAACKSSTFLLSFSFNLFNLMTFPQRCCCY